MSANGSDDVISSATVDADSLSIVGGALVVGAEENSTESPTNANPAPKAVIAIENAIAALSIPAIVDP